MESLVFLRVKRASYFIWYAHISNAWRAISYGSDSVVCQADLCVCCVVFYECARVVSVLIHEPCGRLAFAWMRVFSSVNTAAADCLQQCIHTDAASVLPRCGANKAKERERERKGKNIIS